MSSPPLPPPLQPPVPFADFEFTFDPYLSNLFPNPPTLPPSADLFSPAETTNLLGFLDNVGSFNWELENQELYNEYLQTPIPPYSNPHLNTTPEPSTSTRPRNAPRSAYSTRGHARTVDTNVMDYDHQNTSQSQNPNLDASPSGPSSGFPNQPDPSTFSNPSEVSVPAAQPRSKALLSTPQKRLNHIMSEQKRRNAIRDGYAQLIALLAPAGTAPGVGMPTRGRPKGSGSRGKGQTKGKSGVLFRAVEYCRWLEEGRDALHDEVMRAEHAAGIRNS